MVRVVVPERRGVHHKRRPGTPTWKVAVAGLMMVGAVSTTRVNVCRTLATVLVAVIKMVDCQFRWVCR